ncbi:MAG TPA: DUF2171 domain-containing protein [Dehalococcoidia bacterium]
MPFGLFGLLRKDAREEPRQAVPAAAPRDERLEQIAVGTEVAGSDGEPLGKIREIGDSYLLVIEERSSMRRKKYIPAAWITTIGHSKITLSKNTRWLMDADLTQPPPPAPARTGAHEPLLGAESAQPNFNRETPSRGRTRGSKGPLKPLPPVIVKEEGAAAAEPEPADVE